MRQGSSPGDPVSALSPWPRTECTTGRAATIWSGHSGLPLQPIWKTGARRELGDPTYPQVSAQAASGKLPQHSQPHPGRGARHLLHWLPHMLTFISPEELLSLPRNPTQWDEEKKGRGGTGTGGLVVSA